MPEKTVTKAQAASIAHELEETLSTNVSDSGEGESESLFAFNSFRGIKRVKKPVIIDETHRERKRMIPDFFEPSMMMPTAFTEKPMPELTPKRSSRSA